jgi:hypothetical protein
VRSALKAWHAAEVLEFARVGVDGLVVVFDDREPARLVKAMERFDAELHANRLGRIAASR